MNKNVLGAIGTVIVIALLVWLVGGGKISCRESIWDSDKTIIEFEKN